MQRNEHPTPNPPVHQVQFNGDTLTVIERDGAYYVAIRPICKALGLRYGSQHRRIIEDPVLKSTVYIMRTVGADGKQREMLCLPLEYMHGWLFKIHPDRVAERVREKLIRYQRECYRVLHEHFMGRRGQEPAQASAEKVADAAPALRVRGLRLADLARYCWYREVGLTQQEAGALLGLERRSAGRLEQRLSRTGVRFAQPLSPARRSAAQWEALERAMGLAGSEEVGHA